MIVDRCRSMQIESNSIKFTQKNNLSNFENPQNSGFWGAYPSFIIMKSEKWVKILIYPKNRWNLKVQIEANECGSMWIDVDRCRSTQIDANWIEFNQIHSEKTIFQILKILKILDFGEHILHSYGKGQKLTPPQSVGLDGGFCLYVWTKTCVFRMFRPVGDL